LHAEEDISTVVMSPTAHTSLFRGIHEEEVLRMYGLINQAVKEMICAHGGEALWSTVRQAAHIPNDDWDSLEPYPDSATFALVEAASQQMGLPQSEILRRFGRHWILFTAHHGYGEIMDMFGQDLRSCLKNLNRMHGHMGVMMPHLRPPRFVVDELSADHLIVHYYSQRKGLGEFVIGLLEGLAEKYGERIALRHLPRVEGSDHDEFEVSFLPA